MVFARITGIVIILFGALIGLNYFNIIPTTILGYDFIMIGIILFIVHEAYALIRNLMGGTNKIVGLGVPLVFMIIAGAYFIRQNLPKAIALTIPLITSALMLAEGLYRLH